MSSAVRGNVDTLASVYHAVTAEGVEERPISLTTNPLYDFLGTGDFDDDGKDEILIRRNRDFGLWLYYDIEGRRATLRRNLGVGQNLDFEFAGIGDFNGDGRDDILLRHRDVQSWVYYEMHPTAPGIHRRPGITRNPEFGLQAIADLNGDGTDDVMLRNVRTREWIYYAMTGPRARLLRGLGMTRNPRWTIQGIGDFDGDGRATPLIRLSPTGGWALYDIQGAESEVVHFPGMSREQTWAAVGTLPAFHEGNPAAFSRIEFLQGPPVFRKDFRTGDTIGPINGSRAESGAALEPWKWGDAFFQGPGVDVWFEENHGFVTSVWQRRMVVAVEATHPFRGPSPTLAVELVPVEGAKKVLNVLLDVTEPDERGGYRTEIVFDLPAEDNLPGGFLTISMGTEGAVSEERLPLFGETVEQVSVTWVPVSTENFDAPNLDDPYYMDQLVRLLPLGRYQTRVGDVLAYELTGEEDEGQEIDHWHLFTQVELHGLANRCGNGDVFFGVYPYLAMRDAGIRLPAIGLGWGPTAIAPDGYDYLGFEHEATVYAHEFGHVLELEHAPCNTEGAVLIDADYPYADGALGPARQWLWSATSFVDRDSGRADFMGYCQPEAVSDYTYQRPLMYLQGPHYAEWAADAEACWADDAAGQPLTRSLAVLGSVDANGVVSIIGMTESTMPPLPAGVGGGGGETWRLTVLDAGGAILHDQPLTLEPVPVHAGDKDRGRLWQARVPFAEDANATLVVRDERGGVRVQRPARVVR